MSLLLVEFVRGPLMVSVYIKIVKQLLVYCSYFPRWFSIKHSCLPLTQYQLQRENTTVRVKVRLHPRQKCQQHVKAQSL